MPDHAPDGSKHAVDRKQDRGSARRLIKGNDGDARMLAGTKKPTGQKSASARETDRDLDEALEQTFPASDPVSFESTLVPGSRR
ncbi:hypothetical protein [Hyphomicrobium sp. D-2]|uniref:hypothetical protein n=1 Tax=Hyphomicrobium sp. D-2 TaxID=3041621 RepID=UPI0024566CDB|nr:hypothetical protein [Hyphomicrobium sp. D-2]MDH4983072.1 hypothetical protein [Hyphomicrobium sp. D-2]